MSGQPKDEPTPVGSVADLVEFFRGGEKPPARWLVGTEHEKIGLRADDLSPIPYEGPRGIGAVLEAIAASDGWTRVREGDQVIALEKDGASITLEPGGQLELSGAPLRSIHETCAELNEHLDVVRRVSEPLGLVWLSLGHNPLYDVHEIPHMPKARYAIMRSYLPTRDELGTHMMHLTATVQANLDYESEADMARKFRASMGITAVVSALFANAPLYCGKASGFVSRRLHIWHHTDPDRCGLLPFVFEPGFGYEDYAQWALDVPLFFVVREGRYLPARGTSFRQFLAHGFDGHRATLADWSLHLTTLFPEVRLKRVIELRGADAVPADMTCALPALWKGLLYDAEACEATWQLTKDWSFAERQAALGAVARAGLEARVAGRPVLELAREVVAIAREGLRRIGHAGAGGGDERRFLDPLADCVSRGKSPGEAVLARWEAEWARSPSRLIANSRY